MKYMMKLMREEELESCMVLREQYMKEYKDAINGEGICYGMSRKERNGIANELKDSIHRLDNSIDVLENSIFY